MKAALPYLLAIALVLGYGWSAYEFGRQVRGTEAELATSQELSRALKNLIAADKRVQAAEDQLTTIAAERDQLRVKEADRVTSEHDRFVAGVRSGAVRVSIPVKAASCPAAAAAAGPAASQPEEARAELAPQAAADLAAIARDGDLAIVDLNSCIDTYNDARAAARALNQPAPQSPQTE